MLFHRQVQVENEDFRKLESYVGNNQANSNHTSEGCILQGTNKALDGVSVVTRRLYVKYTVQQLTYTALAG